MQRRRRVVRHGDIQGGKHFAELGTRPIRLYAFRGLLYSVLRGRARDADGYEMDSSSEYGLEVARPTISGLDAFWYLGGPVAANSGYYAQDALTATTNYPGGSPTISWAVLAGSDKMYVYPTSGSSVAGRSTAPSSGPYFDVTVQLDIDGFTSPYFTININVPASLSYGAVESGGYSDCPDFGWQEHNYTISAADLWGNTLTPARHQRKYNSGAQGCGCRNDWVGRICADLRQLAYGLVGGQHVCRQPMVLQL